MSLQGHSQIDGDRCDYAARVSLRSISAGLVQLAVDKRNHGQDVERILFVHVPFDPGIVGQGVADSAVEALQQAYEAALLHPQRFGVVGVDDQERRAVLITKGVVDEVSSVDGAPGELPKLGGDRLHRLEDGMEEVFIEQFRRAELQHIRVDGSLNQGSAKPVGPFQGLVDGRRLVFTLELAVFAKLESTESKHRIELVSAEVEDLGPIRVIGGIHGSRNENDNTVASLVLVLESDKSIEEAFPLGERWVGVHDPAVLQQVTDLRSREPRVRVGQDATDRFQMLGGERRNDVLGFDGHDYNSPRKAR